MARPSTDPADKHPMAEPIPSTPVDRSDAEFMRVLTHELRNHIAPIQNAMHLLRLRSRADQTLLPVAEMIERQLAGMIRTLDAVGDADRAYRGRLVLERSNVSIRTLIDAALQSVSTVVERGAHPVEIIAPPDLPPIDVDAPQITRVIAMLLDNAARYTPAGTPIKVRAEALNDALEIRITDSGSGLTPHRLVRAFMFFAAPHEAGHGLGIGLPLAKALVDLHQGRLEITNVKGGGTEVTVRLPRPFRVADNAHDGDMPAMASPAAPQQTDAASSSPQPVAASPAKGRRVLIADDNAAVRASLGELLQEMGHEVKAAVDGAEAIAMAKAWHPEFVLLDIHMPKLNGFEAARRLRAVFPSTVMQLVMMSGGDLDETMREGARQAGFDHCVDKGLAIGDLTTLLDRRF